VFAFAPMVAFLLSVESITVPWDTPLTSVALYIVVPLILVRDIRPAVVVRIRVPACRNCHEAVTRHPYHASSARSKSAQ